MIRTITVFGLIGAVITAAFMVAGMMSWADKAEPPENGLVVGYLTQVVALTVVFLGIKHHRDIALGGVIKFLPALGVGLAISAVASLGWVIGWEIVLAMSGLDYIGMMKDMVAQQAQASGASAEQVAKQVADMEEFGKLYAIAPARWAITFIEMFPTGVLISLISAAILRNSRFLPPRQATA